MTRTPLRAFGRPVGTALTAACCLVLASCGSGTGLNSVTGKVVDAKGNPLENVSVYFHPKGSKDPQAIRPSGTTGKDGTFKLSVPHKGDGAPAGDYVVLFTLMKIPEGAKPSGTELPQPEDQFNGKYLNAETSKFERTVKSGSNDFTSEPFKLD